MKQLVIGYLLIGLLFKGGLVFAMSTDNSEIEQKLDAINKLLNNPFEGAIDSALELNMEVYELATVSGADSLKMIANLTFAKINFNNGSYHLAIDYFFRVLEYLEKEPGVIVQDKRARRLHYVLTNIGFSYLELEMNNLAMEFFVRASELIEQTEKLYPDVFNVDYKAMTLLNIGAAHLKLNQREEAKNIFDSIDQLTPEISRKDILVANLSNIASLFKVAGSLDQALEKYLEALEIAGSLDDLYYTAAVKVNIAEIYKLKKEHEQAIQYYESAIDYAEKASDWVTLVMAYKALGKIYAEKENFKLALQYIEHAQLLNDSLLKPEKSEFYARLARQYELDKTLRINQHEQEMRWKDHRNRTLYLVLISIIFSLLLFLATLIIKGLKNKIKISLIEKENLELTENQLKLEKAEIQNDLDAKNRAITEKAMFMAQRDELILTIVEKLSVLGASMPENTSKQLDSIINELTNVSSRHFWNEFETRFGEVHSKFFSSLNELYPDLTPAEKKLAAFLRLNLSTKEISMITFKNPDSIKVSRSRLRKKLGLAPADNLVSFLSKF